jgi:RNA polymerase sigma-70 factor, ECF subfamily
MGKSLMKAQSDHLGSLGVYAQAPVLDREGQRILELERQVTQLFDELCRPVYCFLLRLGVSPTDGDEIVQETFFRLCRHLHAGGRGDNLRGWVFSVAHNISINEFKSRKRFVSSAPEDLAEMEAVIDPRCGPEELLLRREKMARVHAAISALSEQQKQCLYLRAEGFRYREIGEILEITISTVAESLRRAIKKLVTESHG